MRLCVFEGRAPENLFPLTMTRPTFELRCGWTTLREKILAFFHETHACYFMRDYLAQVYGKRYREEPINDIKFLKTDDFILANGKWLRRRTDTPPLVDEMVTTCENEVVYAKVKRETLTKILATNLEETLERLRRDVGETPIDVRLISYPWHPVLYNAEALRDDFDSIKNEGVKGMVSPMAAIDGPEDQLYVAETAEVHPFVTLETASGPIIIDRGSKIYPHSRIEGPASIGRETYVYEAKIRPGTTLGPMCRVGGEVDESVFHGYSNKHHEGFLGHSYVGEWVNLGALTTNSDLKNDYSTVQVYVQSKLVDTGEIKVGAFLGDHVKTSIGCLLTTGAVLGVMSNVLATGEAAPKLIPSFTWYFRNKFSRGLGLRRMIDAAETVMARRNIVMSQEEKAMFQRLYEITRDERDKIIRKSRMKARLSARKSGEGIG